MPLSIALRSFYEGPTTHLYTLITLYGGWTPHRAKARKRSHFEPLPTSDVKVNSAPQHGPLHFQRLLLETQASSVATTGSSGSSGGGDGNGAQSQRSPALSSPTNSSGPTLIASNGIKRNASRAGLDSSPTSTASPELEHGDDGSHGEDRRRLPVKRACNECRQQVGILTRLVGQICSML